MKFEVIHYPLTEMVHSPGNLETDDISIPDNCTPVGAEAVFPQYSIPILRVVYRVDN